MSFFIATTHGLAYLDALHNKIYRYAKIFPALHGVFLCVPIPGQYLNKLFYIHGYVEDTCNCVRIIKVADLQSNYYQELFSTFFHLYLEKYVVLILSEKTITTIVYHTY